MTPGEALFIAGLPTGPKGDPIPGHTKWTDLGPQAQARSERMAVAAVRAAAEDSDLLRAAHLAIEDVLVECRDERLSTPFVANGFVCREKDGKPSSQIRLSTQEGLHIGLKAIAEHMEKQ